MLTARGGGQIRVYDDAGNVIQGRILHCVYPVFAPDEDAGRVIEWIRRHAA